MKYLICSLFQLVKQQFGSARPVTGTLVHAADIVSFDLSRHIRDKLPVQNREDFIELEAWLSDGDDEVMTTNRAHLRDFIARGACGTTEREYVYNACLRLFTKRFASRSMSWAGAKGNKEFTLKTSKVWGPLSDVIGAKFSNFQQYMAIYFNSFQKDFGREATRAGGGRGRDAVDVKRGDVDGRGAGNEGAPAALPVEPQGNVTHNLEGDVEEEEDTVAPDDDVHAESAVVFEHATPEI